MSDILVVILFITFIYYLRVKFLKLILITYLNMKLKKSLSFRQILKLLFCKVEKWEEIVKGWEE